MAYQVECGPRVSRLAVSVGVLWLCHACSDGFSSNGRPGGEPQDAGTGANGSNPGGSAGGSTGGGAGGTNNGGDAGTTGSAGTTSSGGAAGGGQSCEPDTTASCWAASNGDAFDTPEPVSLEGICQLGETTCNSSGEWGPCLGAVPPEAEDTCEPSNDADCDGRPNEGCSCEPEKTQDCGKDTGPCEKGTQLCGADGTWGECVGGVRAAASDGCVEEGDDANCNGEPNDACECLGEEEEPCNDCGTRTCDSDTGHWGVCEGDTALVRCGATNREICSEDGSWIADPNACRVGTVCAGEAAVCLLADGQTCSEGTECGAGVCNAYYTDADNDGYRLDTTVHSLCGTAVEGFVRIDTSRGTDCCDRDENTHPGADFYGEESACGGFNHNCDLTTDQESTVTTLCERGTSDADYCTTLGSSTGWDINVNEPPKCGQSGVYQLDCTLEGDVCVHPTEVRVQRCR